MTCDAFRPLLHPYLDGELEASGLAQAESHLAACASCREQVAEYRRLRGLVREAMPLRAPRSLRDPARWKASRSGPHDETRRWSGLLAACAAVLLVGLASWWLAPLFDPHADEVQEAAEVHERTQLPGALSLASGDPATIAPWLARQLAYTPWTGVLGKECQLKGARLDYCDHQRVAVLVFEHHHHLISLITYPSDDGDDSGRTLRTQAGVTLCDWSQGHLEFVMVSDLPQAELEHISRMVPVAL